MANTVTEMRTSVARQLERYERKLGRGLFIRAASAGLDRTTL
jgi:hypothetical protein